MFGLRGANKCKMNAELTCAEAAKPLPLLVAIEVVLTYECKIMHVIQKKRTRLTTLLCSPCCLEPSIIAESTGEFETITYRNA